MDVLPSQIYPNLEPAENFRLNKANLILAHLQQQTKHYEWVMIRKGYARAQNILQKTSITTGSLSVVLTTSGIATSVTGPGVVVGIPLGAVGGLCGIISAVTASVAKKLSGKISKHDSTISLSRAKANTIADLVSKALRDRKIDDVEFSLILAEEGKYEKLKAEIRHPNPGVRDDSELKKKIYSQAMVDIRKKIDQ